MNFPKFLVFLLIVTASLGFTWPGQKAKPKAENKTEVKKTASVQTSSKAAAGGEADEGNPYNLPQVPTLPDIPIVRPVTNPLPDVALPQTNAGVPKVEVPRPPQQEKLNAPTMIDQAKYGDVSITKIQDQINEIIHFNDDLKMRRQDQIREIQRIRDQAYVHQKILDDIKKYQKVKPARKQSDTENILQQEKIRLIRDETSKNREFINNLNQDKTAPKQDAKTQAAVS